MSPQSVGKDATFENFFKAEKRHPPPPVMKNDIFVCGTKKITKFMSSWFTKNISLTRMLKFHANFQSHALLHNFPFTSQLGKSAACEGVLAALGLVD